MIYQIIFDVTYPIVDNEPESEIRLSFINTLKKFESDKIFQTHTHCWFLKSELSANEIFEIIKPGKNANILISNIENPIIGLSFKTFWEWLKE